MPDRTCFECSDPAASRGLCSRHYYRAWRQGRLDSDYPLRCLVIEDCDGSEVHRAACAFHRFERKVDRTSSSCWLWTGTTNDMGYGLFKTGGRWRSAHRWSYEHHRGPIPEGLVLDHLCRVHACVNPLHLEAVTQQTNIHRGVSIVAQHARQTSCKNGHPLLPGSYWLSKQGWRMCKECDRERKNRRRQERKASAPKG